MNKLILTFLIVISTFTAFSQTGSNYTKADTTGEEKLDPLFYETPKAKFLTKLRYGGDFWLAIFRGFYVDAAPMLGYQISNYAPTIGVGVRLVNGDVNGKNYLSYGPKVFLRQPLFRVFFADFEYQYISANENQFYSYVDQGNPLASTTRKWEGSTFVGLGYYQNRMRLQKGGYISLMCNLGKFNNRGYISPYNIFVTGAALNMRIGYFF